MSRVYKILARQAWEAAAAQGQFDGAAIDLADGYIHLSTAAQAQETARRHFLGQDDLVVAAFEAEDLGEALRWEPSRGGQLFPHLYGALDPALALAITTAPLDAAGVPVLDFGRMSLLQDLTARALLGLSPEDAHGAAIRGLKAGLGPREGGLDDPCLAVRLCGMQLPSCIGLAAGFDKDAEVPDAMLAAGFGFVECGTVTPLPQAGNPRPRLFRLSEDRAVINRMGFNNKGLETFAGRLTARRGRQGTVGANIGANKDAEDRIGDYVAGLRRLWPLADYFTINVSSPNTPGLRELQSGSALDELLGRLDETRREVEMSGPTLKPRPLFLKVAPDLDELQIMAICDAVARHGFEGVIAGNTTLSRPSTLRSRSRREAGGLSGAPLKSLSTAVLERFHAFAGGRFILIGAGGVASGADAYAKIRAGANAVQLYSALVYGGPGLVGRIKRDLALRLRADGFVSVVEATGAG